MRCRHGLRKNGNNGGGNGGCGVGQQTNGCGDPSSGGGIINNGGAGGAGVGVGIGYGQGGDASAVGGQGGSVLGSGNSANSNRNDNRNTNTNMQGQAQGQQQGQGQAQRSSNRNDNRSSARNTNSNANSGNNSAQSVTVQGDHYEAPRIPVATAYAAPLVAGTGTCMGSTTVGGQGMTIGISVGSTWEDHGCTMRSNAATLYSLGEQKAAVALLCQDASISSAMTAAGTPCPGTESKVATVAPATAHPTKAEASAGYTGTDPIVRRRLGLPPLK